MWLSRTETNPWRLKSRLGLRSRPAPVKRIIELILAVIVLTACSPEIHPAEPLATPQIWQVQTTPALAWLGESFQACAAAQPGVNLVVSQHSAAEIDPLKADFSFQWGQRSQPPLFAAVIGQDTLAVVVNPANPIEQLSVDDVKAIFGSQRAAWGQVIATPCANCGLDASSAVKAYVYAAGEDVRQAADWIPSGPDAILAPGPAAARQAVAQDAGGIAYLPGHWVDSTVKKVTITGADPAMLSQPILALAGAEPQGEKRAWLLCVQEKIK